MVIDMSSSLDLVLETAGMKRTERAPVIPQVFGHAAFFNNVPLNDYLKDGRLLAECQVHAMEDYGYDAVFAMMDTNVEAEALGADIVYRDRLYPYIKRPYLDSADGISVLEVPDPEKDGRMPEMLEAIKTLRKDLDGKILVTSVLLGPMTLVCQLLGTEKALYLLADDRALFLELLGFAKRIVISFGTAQVKAGSQVPILFDPAASPVVLPVGLFKEVEVPSLVEVNKVLMNAGAVGTWLHIAGPSRRILSLFQRGRGDDS